MTTIVGERGPELFVPSPAPRDDLIRANLTRASAEGRTMVGFPIVFDTWTEIHSWEGDFRERVGDGAVRKTLSESRDQIKVLFDHGMDPMIGDKPLGKPSVMDAQKRGLYTETPLSQTSYNDDLLALMEDGAIDGMSFRFSVVKDEWAYPKEDLPERTITELRLYEFGPVTFPAYQATTVGIRSRSDFKEWRGLTDDKRAEIAAMIGISTDLRTHDSEPQEHSDETSRTDRPDEPHTHSEAPIPARRHLARRALRLERARTLGVIQ